MTLNSLPQHHIGPDMTVAEKLRTALAVTHMTQLELAQQLAEPGADTRRVENVRRLVNKWLAGSRPGRAYALRLAEVFGTASDYFVSGPSEQTRSGVSGEARELLNLVWDASASRLPPDGWQEIPPRFPKSFIADQLARNFDVEHILVDEVDEWQALEYAKGTAKMSKDTLGLGQWYTDSELIPGMLILEALAQIASVALLTDEMYRQRLVFVAGFNHPRIKRVVSSDEKLTLTAHLDEPTHGQIAHYETEARLETGELAARAVVILAAH